MILALGGAAALLVGALALALAFVGWGRGVARAVGAGDAVDPGLAMAVGLALTIVAGGLPNLLCLLSPGALRAWVAVGIALALQDAWARRAALRERLERGAAALRADRAALACACALALLALLLAAAGGRAPLHVWDDHNAYAALPGKILAQGGLGTDPLCSRRLVGGLGGQSLLLAVVASVLGLDHLPALEHGLAPLLLTLVVFGHGAARRLPPRALLFACAVALLVHIPAGNLTSSPGAAGLLIALLRALDLDAAVPRRARLALVVLLVAALVATKATNAPAAALITLGWHLGRDGLPRGVSRAVLVSLAIGAAATLLVVPWMLDLWRSNGTPFHPLLGRGLDGVVHGTYRSPGSDLTPARALDHAVKLLTCARALAHVLLLAAPGWRPDVRRGLVWVVALGWLAAAGVVLAADGFARYADPIITALTLCLVVVALDPASRACSVRSDSPADAPEPEPSRVALAAIACAAFAIGADWQERRAHLIRRAASLRSVEPWPAAEQERLRALHALVPAGETLAASVARPGLLDLARNRVWIIDQPGAAGPPGLPALTSTGDELAACLTGLGARYLLVEEGLTPWGRASPEHDPRDHAWTTTCLQHALAFDRLVAELRRTRRVLGQDGRLVLIDLSAR